MNGNIRSIKDLDDDDLRASFKAAGWNKHLPAIKDEHGKVLVGHRRLKIAEEENIEPVIKVVTFGEGKDADDERLQLAVISNIGAAPLTAVDRKRLAERLYKDGMTMVAIGKVLGASQATITRDLNLFIVNKSKPAKTEKNPKGAGRPKGSGMARRTGGRARSERVPQAVEREERVATLLDAGLSTAEIAIETGMNERVVDQALEHVEIAREAAAMAGMQTSREDLSLSAQKKFDAAIRQYQRKLDVEFEKKLRQGIKDGIQRGLDETVLPHLNEKKVMYERLLASRRYGIMKRPAYNLIRSCLHTDSRRSATDEKLNRAFQVWSDLEVVVLSAAEAPVDPGPALPTSFAEMVERRKAAQAGRKNKRQQRSANQVRRK